MSKSSVIHDRICPETNVKCQTGFCLPGGACSIQEVEKHCNGRCEKSKGLYDKECPVHGYNVTPITINAVITSEAAKEFWQVQGMRWVKADERTPEQTKGPVMTVLKFKLEDGDQWRVSTINQFLDLLKTGIPEQSKIEWLEELSTPPSSDKVNEK